MSGRPGEIERIEIRHQEAILASLDTIREYEKYVRSRAEQGKAVQAAGYADRLLAAAGDISARIAALDAIREVRQYLPVPVTGDDGRWIW